MRTGVNLIRRMPALFGTAIRRLAPDRPTAQTRGGRPQNVTRPGRTNIRRYIAISEIGIPGRLANNACPAPRRHSADKRRWASVPAFGRLRPCPATTVVSTGCPAGGSGMGPRRCLPPCWLTFFGHGIRRVVPRPAGERAAGANYPMAGWWLAGCAAAVAVDAVAVMSLLGNGGLELGPLPAIPVAPPPSLAGRVHR
jgi:hypothetical protein